MPSRAMAEDRALATLLGGALGDALGMPTQLLSPDQIEAAYGFVDDFVAPADDHPVSKGLQAGTITDDTEQTLLLARVLLASPQGFDHKRWVNALIDWERDVKARGSYDLLGPSTKRAIDAINDGIAPEDAGRGGDTNGAAMRIAPVGIVMPADPLGALVSKVAETCRATHNTTVAIASAAAVAATVSAGLDGADWRRAVDHGIEAAALGSSIGHDASGIDIADKIRAAMELVRDKEKRHAIVTIAEHIGTGVAASESVPAAFAVLEIASGDPWLASVISANLGGDTDTIGAIAASMAGACAGMSLLPETRIAGLRGIDLEGVKSLSSELVAARFRLAGGKEAA